MASDRELTGSGERRIAIRDIGGRVLVVALMLLLATILAYLLHYAIHGRNDEEEPSISFESYASKDGDYIVEITEADPGDYWAGDMHWIVLDDRGTAVPGWQSSVDDILTKDPYYPYGLDEWDRISVPVIYVDLDNNGRVSAGDYFTHQDPRETGYCGKKTAPGWKFPGQINEGQSGQRH